ncbi:MAG: hypothetical protein PVG89_05360 [Gammaproteobacteria bacterium]
MLSRPVKYIFHRPAILGLIIIAISALSVTAWADAPLPDISKPEGKDQCVEPTDFMRKSHMDLLLHQRDETMHRGIRTKKHSLKECIDCHAVYDNSGQPVSHLNSKHFCVQCHEYASVSIDCFDCHASKPEQKKAERSL